LKLLTDAITVVRRSDGSGTTFVSTDYLSKVNAEWKTKGCRHRGGWLTGVG
jgi:phosphate transport system substrate-binding protein